MRGEMERLRGDVDGVTPLPMAGRANWKPLRPCVDSRVRRILERRTPVLELWQTARIKIERAAQVSYIMDIMDR